MNVTFLIGNGFDLNCGLKTRYKDVYNEYCQTQSSSELIKKFKEDINMNIENWGDFEVAMCNYLPNFNSEQDFLVCLRDFKSFLNSYLIRINNEFNRKVRQITDISPVSKELLDSLENFYKGITHSLTNTIDRIIINDPKFSVITFNYTSSFETIYSNSRRGLSLPEISTNHIHGILNDDVVLGMDSIEQIKDIKFHLTNKGIRAFIKPVFNELYDFDRLNSAKETIEKSSVICVYGMSLGISDYSWRNMLYDWLSKEPNRHLFVYQHSLCGIKVWSAEEKLDYEEDAKMKFLQDDWQLSGKQIDLVFDKLHMPCGKNIFNFNDAFNKAKDNSEQLRKIASRFAP